MFLWEAKYYSDSKCLKKSCLEPPDEQLERKNQILTKNTVAHLGHKKSSDQRFETYTGTNIVSGLLFTISQVSVLQKVVSTELHYLN